MDVGEGKVNKMIEVHERVLVGSDLDCRSGGPDIAVVHACKSPCHQRAVGYRGSLPSSHPNYLVLEREFDLYLNIIDPPVPLFRPELFQAFLSFADRHWGAGRTLLIHCNQAESRAPTLALLFLAKRLRSINAESFEQARREFLSKYPAYRPGEGLRQYMTLNWTSL